LSESAFKHCPIYLINMSVLDEIAKQARAAFIIAKTDGVLTADEVVKIAGDLTLKINKVLLLSAEEKKALLIHTLNKGFDESGGLDTLIDAASDDVKASVKNHVLDAAIAAAELLASSRYNFQIPAKWLSYFSCLKKTLHLKDCDLIAEAVAFVGPTRTKSLKLRGVAGDQVPS
jgi:hypothetical protein